MAQAYRPGEPSSQKPATAAASAAALAAAVPPLMASGLPQQQEPSRGSADANAEEPRRWGPPSFCSPRSPGGSAVVAPPPEPLPKARTPRGSSRGPATLTPRGSSSRPPAKKPGEEDPVWEKDVIEDKKMERAAVELALKVAAVAKKQEPLPEEPRRKKANGLVLESATGSR